MKGQNTGWVKITDLAKDLYLEYIIDPQNSTIKKKPSNTPVRKWAKNLHRHFFEEDT